jgi:ribosomal protein S7
LLTKNGKKSFGFYILFTTLDRLKVLTRVAGLPLFVSAILSLRPILSISTVEQGRKKVDKYKLLSSQAQVSKALTFFFSLVRKLDSKYDLVTRILVVIVSLVLRKNNALQKLRSMLKLAVLNKYKVAPQLISIPKGSSGFQSSVRRPKKMKGQYFSNYYGLYRKIQYTK